MYLLLIFFPYIYEKISSICTVLIYNFSFTVYETKYNKIYLKMAITI